MKDRTVNRSRRRLIQGSVAAALMPIPVALGTRAASAAERPRLEEDDANAKALNYVHDASRLEPAARGGADRICASCRFYTDATAPAWGPCTLFPGKAVSAKGWCSAWVTRGS